jgi:uncharacterized C2H2 Zn-finger protein
VGGLGTSTIILAYIAFTVLLALILTPRYWPFGLMLWIGITAISLLVVVWWHAENTVYRCQKCDHLFRINTATDLVSPHGLGRGGGWKLLTCPKCGHYGKAQVIEKDDLNKGA